MGQGLPEYDDLLFGQKDHITLAAIGWLLPILRNARKRPQMYFRPIGPVAMTHWLHGLYTGLSFWGVDWSMEHRKAPVERRGLEQKASYNDEDLEARGLSPPEIVHEILSIEIEMWEAHRDAIWDEARRQPRQPD